MWTYNNDIFPFGTSFTTTGVYEKDNQVDGKQKERNNKLSIMSLNYFYILQYLNSPVPINTFCDIKNYVYLIYSIMSI